MRIAVSFPTTYQLVEKLCVLFNEVTLIGFNGPYSSEQRYELELNKIGYKVNFRREHYSEIDPNDYDLLIDSWETRGYNNEWNDYSRKWKIPRIIKVLWSWNLQTFSPEDMELFKHSIVSVENYTLENVWKKAGVPFVEVLLYPPGPWWFSKPWTGEINKCLYVCVCGPSRCLSSVGFSDWKNLRKVLPQYTHHQDAAKTWFSSPDLADFCRKYRCYVNLDQTSRARPLCLVFTEMICAGIPPIIIQRDNTDYHRFIENGKSGFICKNIDEVAQKIKILVEDYDLAGSMSAETSKIARAAFSNEVLYPKWMNVIEMAKQLV